MTKIIFIFVIIHILFTICSAIRCPCNVGPCPSVSTNGSIVDTCTRTYSHTYCVRTLNLTIQDGQIVKKREIYRCANFSTAKHEMELMIHVPLNDSDQVTIEYRCRNHDYCSLEHLQDDSCDLSASTDFASSSSPYQITSEEIRNLQPQIEKLKSSPNPAESRTCRCVDSKQVGKLSDHSDRQCRWTNDVRRDSGRNLPYCRTGIDRPSINNTRSDLRASIFCRGIDLGTGRLGGEMRLKHVVDDGFDKPRRFRCNFVCRYADRCNQEKEFENIYCAAIRQLRAVTKNEPITFKIDQKSNDRQIDLGVGKQSIDHKSGDHSGNDQIQTDQPKDFDQSKSPSIDNGSVSVASETTTPSQEVQTGATNAIVTDEYENSDSDEESDLTTTAAMTTVASVTVYGAGPVGGGGSKQTSGGQRVIKDSFLMGMYLLIFLALFFS